MHGGSGALRMFNLIHNLLFRYNSDGDLPEERSVDLYRIKISLIFLCIGSLDVSISIIHAFKMN